MLQSSGKLRKSSRVEPSIYQAWVPPLFSEPNGEDEIKISFKRCERLYEPSLAKNENSDKKACETLKNLRFLLRGMETDFNYLSGEKILEHMSKNYASESQRFPLYAEKLILTRDEDLKVANFSSIKNRNDFDLTNLFKNELSWSINKSQKTFSTQKNVFDETKISSKSVNKSTVDSSPVSYGKLWEMTINQQIFINIIDNWRKSVSFIFNDNYKNLNYTLNEGLELLREGIELSNKIRLPELESLVNAVEYSVAFEEKIKKLLSIENESTVDLGSLKTTCKIPITELYELLKEGENCVFRSNYLDFLKSQLEKLKSWRSNVQSAIIEKNLDKCKDSIKDKDEILIEFTGINDLNEQIAASNWIEKVERSLSRPMKLNFAENLLNEPAAKFLDEKNVSAKQQLINRVSKAQEWLNIVQSPPFVYNLVAACKITAPNDISETTQNIIDQAKVFMEKSKEWKLPKPSEFEKVWLESSTLKIIIPLMKYMEPVYLRWRKWNKKYKRLMDGLCIYMEAQLILEEAEYTLCEYLDMSEYLPELRRKIEESGNWLNTSKEFLKTVSDFHTKQDINYVSSSIWNTISGIKKGNEFSRLEIQQVLDFMNSQFQERLSYGKLKQLIETGNELTIYEMTILQELTSCQDGCEKWLKKGKEYLKCSKISGINTATVINLLLERSCILVSKETEDSLFAELHFILWKMDINKIQAPINDFELNSLIKRFNDINSYIDFDHSDLSKTESVALVQSKKLMVLSLPNIKKESDEFVSQNNDSTVHSLNACESNATQPEAIFCTKSPEINIKELDIQQINISHWNQIKELEATAFIEKLQNILIYWTDLIHQYETEKKDIVTWRNILENLKHLPISFNELESKINKMMNDYDRIVSILKVGDEESNNSLDLKHPFSLLNSYKRLSEINFEISDLPIRIIEWDKWQIYLDELNRCDEYTLSEFSYLKEIEGACSNIEDTNIVQIERKTVINYLNNINERLTSKSLWGITDFRNILTELKYTGRLIQDLSICECWIKDVQGGNSLNGSMGIEYWNSLLQKGRTIRIIDHEIFKEFETQVMQSIEWNEIYLTVLSSNTFNKANKYKKSNKFQYNKILYSIAELLVRVDYGIGERLITFRELKKSVDSFNELRSQGIQYLNICINERRDKFFSKLLNKYLNRFQDKNDQESEISNQIDSIKNFTLSLKNLLESCIKHPISMNITSYIQEEISLREINEKMFNALINKENPYFSTISHSVPITLNESKILTFNEASDIVDFIIENKLNIMPETNSNMNETKDFQTNFSEITRENQLTINELKEIVLNSESFVLKEPDLTEISAENKYIDIDLFEKFKKAVYISNEWLKIYKMFHFNITENQKTESFHSKEISENLLSYNVKSSLDYLIKEYLESDAGVSLINSTPQKGHFVNKLKFQLNWKQILDRYSNSNITDLIPFQERNNYLIRRLLNVLKIDESFTDLSMPDKDVTCKNEQSHELFCNDYSKYNVSLSMNLLHYLRNNKNALSNNVKSYYEDLLNSIKSYINVKYCKHLSDDEKFNIEQLEECLSANGFLRSRESEYKNETTPDPNFPTQNINYKRNKRSKSLINGEKLNEENIDGIINLLKNIEMPTIELSLFLINYGKRFIKFGLKELSDLCQMVEFSLLWMTLIVHRFPIIIKTNLGDDIDEINCIEPAKKQNDLFIFESWEKNVCFDFFDSNNILISSINISDIANFECKHIQRTSSLKEFISFIETCDQLPIQIPMKSRLVNILVDSLKWAISAREAILLLPNNTILSPWMHIEGKVKEITPRSKKSKIMKTISLDKNSYNIQEEEIMNILSGLNIYECEPGFNLEKNNEIGIQVKKPPRPRGRPKREQADLTKNDSQFEDVFNNICLDYKEIDQSPNCIFPKSFYLWLLDKNNKNDFNVKELLSILMIDEDEKSFKTNNLQSCDSNTRSENDYFYWNRSSKSGPKESVIDENDKKICLSQYIGLIDPRNYPKKEIYKNKLLIDYILCIEVYNSIEKNPAKLCSICSNFGKRKNNISPALGCNSRWIACDECIRWYHQDCVEYSFKTNHFPGKLSNNSSLANEFSSWICPSCTLRSETSISRSASIINFLKNSINFELCHNNNAYILSDIHCKSIDQSEENGISDSLLKREVPSLENLKQIMKKSLSEKIFFIKLHERNIIANTFYLHNVWVNDFYRLFKWDQCELSEFNSLVFIDPFEIQEPLIDRDLIFKEKSEPSDEIEINEILGKEKEIEHYKVINISNSTQTSRKGRLLKNKISAKEMLNPKLASVKPKKGRKRRILFPNKMVAKQIKRNIPSTMNNLTRTLQLNFNMIFQDINNEYLCSIDPEYIGRIKIIEPGSSKPLEIDEVLNLYINATLIGLDGVVEIEWLYCILKYLVFFNSKFASYSENLAILKNFQLSEDLSFINTLKHQKRLSWEDFKYILVHFSPNFPIKLKSYKIFYFNLPKARFLQLQCLSIFNCIKNFSQENFTKPLSTDQNNRNLFTNPEQFKLNGKNFKTEVESLLINIVKSGIIIPEENIISHLLLTYYLESILLLYGKQISNVYCNQLNPKPLHSTLVKINQQILFWKESDANLTKIYNFRLIPPEYYGLVFEDESVCFQNQENKPITRIKRFIKCFETIQDSINQCNEWNERYKFLMETPNDFEVYVEFLKQGLNLPCIYPAVYSFGNILASIESYEDFVNQVFDNSGNLNSLTKVSNPPGSFNQTLTQTPGTIVGSNQPSLNPKFENIQILKNVKEFLKSLPIQKNDLILKIDQMEENTQRFIEGIKQKIPQLKQLGSTEALITQLQLIKEEAIHKVPIIVNNVPELRELLNNIPDFGSPHHNLLLRTQFLMSLQCPIAKLRKPLNPFPNIPETSSSLHNIIGQNQSNELYQLETKGELIDSQVNNSNKSILHVLNGANNKFNTSCQLPNSMSFIWQNLVQQGSNPMMKSCCYSIGGGSCTDPNNFNTDWCSLMHINDEDSNDIQYKLNSSKTDESTEIHKRISTNSTDINDLVNYFIKSALNGVSVDIYDHTSQSFVSGKYYINRNLNIITFKSPVHTIIIPFKAINTLLNSSEFNYLYSNSNNTLNDYNKQIITIIFDSNMEKSDTVSVLFNDQNSANNFLLVVEILRYNEMSEECYRDNSEESAIENKIPNLQ
ncbi:chromatin protein [Cryptosporidium ubiquitum]|uniref:Chromatin protein n=1 Tax=Cryptosporidium ubiquitum TaxID=857276 RepID=A0A1J4MK71_9CRYT|nr:chromatin protein [Cryptosporidium ubiquitum]OII74606.1 chromatin protein [Cryptosporidium ubiquitum]